MSVSKCLFKYNHTKLDILSHFFKEVVYPIGCHENQLGTRGANNGLDVVFLHFVRIILEEVNA